MLKHFLAFFVFLNILELVLSKIEVHHSDNVITAKTYAIWKNASVPFYVDPEHYDHEQTLTILTALSMFAFKTCIKFKPVMARPAATDEVLVFVNPEGTRRCEIEPKGHSVYNPHIVKLGYECLKSPDIDMIIMKALGFPFEHNRVTRDLYIDVLQENILPGAIELFLKEDKLPLELRFLPYDMNSVMHFGTRDYSKNGHRTIIFKDHNVQQNRVGLSKIDLKKIELIYGPECRARDRQEKMELCKSYPGVARKKREVDLNALEDKGNSPRKAEDIKLTRRKRQLDIDVTRSLRVNPDITPPPGNRTDDVTKTLKELGIDQPVQDLVEQVYKVSSLALKTARDKFCNNSDVKPPIIEDINVNRNSSDILGIIEVVADFAKGMVSNAVKNLTKFCEVSDAIEVYQRYSCNWNARDPRCRESYRSTNSGPVRYSTQHRPIIPQSTRHRGGASAVQYGRTGNKTESGEEKPTTQSVRRKREVETTEKAADKSNATKKPEDREIFKVSDKTGVNGDQNKSDRDETNKEKTDLENKAVDMPKKDKEEVNNNKDTVVAEKDDEAKTNNETVLRAGTMAPGTRSKNNRRKLQGRMLRDKRIKDSEKEVSTEELEKNYQEKEKRKERDPRVMKRKPKKRKPTAHLLADDDNSKNLEETHERFKELNKKDNYYHGNGDPRNVKEDKEQRPRKRRKPKNEKPGTSFLPRTVTLSKKNEEFYSERRWPNGELPYIIQEDTTYDLEDMRNRLEEVNEYLKKKTCVKMKEISPDEADQYEDYIVIDASPDYVTGRVGGRQNFGSIELFQGGQHRQHAAMMVMGMLGFYFEVSRHDRDKYVRVHMRHVRPDKLHHFEMIRSDATLPLPYDYASATHPAWQFWRQIGRTGISTVATFKEKDPDSRIMKSLGQNEKLLSNIDIVKINSVYGVDCFRHPRAKIEIHLASSNKSLP